MAVGVYSINSNFSNFGNSLNFEIRTSIFGKTKKQRQILQQKLKCPLGAFIASVGSSIFLTNFHHSDSHSKITVHENDDKK